MSKDEALENAILSSCNQHLYFSTDYKLARPITTTHEILNLGIRELYKNSILDFHEFLHILNAGKTFSKRELLLQEFKNCLHKKIDHKFIETYNRNFVDVSEIFAYYFQLMVAYTPIELRDGILNKLKKTNGIKILYSLDYFLRNIIENTKEIKVRGSVHIKALMDLYDSIKFITRRIDDIYYVHSKFIKLIKFSKDELPKFNNDAEWKQFFINYLSSRSTVIEDLYREASRDSAFFDAVIKFVKLDAENLLNSYIFGILEEFNLPTTAISYEVDNLVKPTKFKIDKCLFYPELFSIEMRKNKESISYLKNENSLLKKFKKFEKELKDSERHLPMFGKIFKLYPNHFKKCNTTVCSGKERCELQLKLYSEFKEIITSMPAN